MRDKRFVAEHRDGPLKREQHNQLFCWASACVAHTFVLLENGEKVQLAAILATGHTWVNGVASVGSARTASLEAIALAKEYTSPSSIAIARAVGHAVATAHMADHSLRAADYALKAVAASGRPLQPERIWQEEQLPDDIRSLVISARKK